MTERVVAFTVSGQREKYLRQSLDTWARVRGKDTWTFLFALEPCDQVFPVDAFFAWAQGIFPGCHLLKNGKRLGCAGNTRRAMDCAFGDLGAEFAVLAEEDVEVCDDICEYFAWAAGQYSADDGIIATCAHARDSQNTSLSAVARAPWFSPLVWGTWRDTWAKVIRPGWGGITGNAEAWDTNLRSRLQLSGQQCLFPALSRALHIGELSTLNAPALSEYMYDLSRSGCFVPQAGPQDYRETEFDALAGLVV